MNRQLINSMLILFSWIGFVQGQIDWQAPSEIAATEFGNHHPRIATDGNDKAFVIWGNRGKLMFSLYSDGTFATPLTLNPDGMSIAEASWMGPSIAAHGDTIYIVFKETPENQSASHIWCIRSYNGGETFLDPVRVDSIGQDLSRFPTVTTNDSGNPVVGFMRFDPSFHNPRWVVTKSEDHGASFQKDVLASGWSSPTSEACDCCPGEVQTSNSYVAMIYRDNDENVRDNWVGVSNTSGDSFELGVNIDQNNWNYPICPSSGPDGIILGDSLYSVFMSAASGKSRVYFNSSHLTSTNTTPGVALTSDYLALIRQNYIRIDNDGAKAAIAWVQRSDGEELIPLLFARDIAQKQFIKDTVAITDAENVDLAVGSDQIFVVWQDNDSRTLRYRIGTIEMPNANKNVTVNRWEVFPNPSSNQWILKTNKLNSAVTLSLYDHMGKVLSTKVVNRVSNEMNFRIPNGHLLPGHYFLNIKSKGGQQTIILIKK